MRLRDKVAVVTGSTRGIGEAIVRVFYKEGAKVVITGRDELKGLAIKDQLEKTASMRNFLIRGLDVSLSNLNGVNGGRA